MFCQNALLDEAVTARLGAELAKQCQELCDERTRALRHWTVFGKGFAWGGSANVVYQARAWEDRSRALYDLAAKVATALEK